MYIKGKQPGMHLQQQLEKNAVVCTSLNIFSYFHHQHIQTTMLTNKFVCLECYMHLIHTAIPIIITSPSSLLGKYQKKPLKTFKTPWWSAMCNSSSSSEKRKGQYYPPKMFFFRYSHSHTFYYLFSSRELYTCFCCYFLKNERKKCFKKHLRKCKYTGQYQG